MTPKPSLPQPSDCQAFERALQQVLDRECTIETIDRSHAGECLDCQALFAATESLMAGLERMADFPMPPNLGERIELAVAKDYRRRQTARWAGRGAVAALVAAILLVVVGNAPWQSRPSEREIVQPSPAFHSPDLNSIPDASNRVSDRVAEAGSALASITRKASDQALTPTRTFVPPDKVSFTGPTLPGGLEPAADSLAGMPESARAGFEPVTSGARRAVNLFLRDTGLGTARPKS
jgi:hypothetical protein